jgi:hypothetical protein
VLATLSIREAGVIQLRFGLIDGQPHTLDEIGRVYGVTRERIRQIESHAMTSSDTPHMHERCTTTSSSVTRRRSSRSQFAWPRRGQTQRAVPAHTGPSGPLTRACRPQVIWAVRPGPRRRVDHHAGRYEPPCRSAGYGDLVA